MEFNLSLALDSVRGNNSSELAILESRPQVDQVTPSLHNEDYLKMLDRLFRKWNQASNFSWAFLEPFLPKSIEEKTEEDIKNEQRLTALEEVQQEQTLLPSPTRITAQIPLLSNPSSSQGASSSYGTF